MNKAPTSDSLVNGQWSEVWRGWFLTAWTLFRDFEDGFFYRARKITASATMKRNDSAVLVDATAGAVTYTLLPAAQCRGKRLSVKKIDASGNSVTIDGSGSETIDGATTKATSTQYVSFDLVPDPSNSTWHLV